MRREMAQTEGWAGRTGQSCACARGKADESTIPGLLAEAKRASRPKIVSGLEAQECNVYLGVAAMVNTAQHGVVGSWAGPH